MRERLILLALLCLPAAALAKAWRGIEPGTSLRADVILAFGEPHVSREKDDAEILAYMGKNGISGTTEVQFKISKTSGVVERIDVFPSSVTDRASIESTYGPACGAPAKPGTSACYKERIGKSNRPYLFYKAYRLAVFLAPDKQGVSSMVFQPELATAKEAPADEKGAKRDAVATKKRKDEATSPAGGGSGAGKEPAPADSWPGDSTSADASGAGSSASSSEGSAPAEDDWGASTTSFAPVAESPTLEKTVELGGKVVAENQTFVHGPPHDAVTGAANIEAVLFGRVKAGEVKAYASLLGRREFLDPTRNRFDVPEAYASIDGSVLQLSAGRILVAWGTANLLNPTDILNPIDRNDLLQTEKRGSWMVRGRVVLGAFLFEGYYLPLAEPHILPTLSGIADDGTFVSTSPWVKGGLDQEPGLPLRYHIGSVSPPPATLENGQGAARLGVSLLGADLHLGYAYLFDKLPVVRTALDLSSFPLAVDVTLSLEYRRVHLATFDFERTFGPVRVAGEVLGYRVARKPLPDEPGPLPSDQPPSIASEQSTYVTYVFGMDYRTPQFRNDHYVHLFAEVTQARGIESRLQDDLYGVLRHPLHPMALLRASYHAGAAWTVELNGASAVDRRDFFVNGRVTFSFADALKAKIGGYYLGGDDKGTFGRYDGYARVDSSLEVSF